MGVREHVRDGREGGCTTGSSTSTRTVVAAGTVNWRGVVPGGEV